MPLVAAAEAETSDEVTYTVQPGDTLGMLARNKLDVPARWRDVAAYNQLLDPDFIEPGQVLRLKRVWLKARPGVFKVEAVTGQVRVGRRALQVGDSLPAGMEIATDKGAALRLRAPDGSQVDLQEASRLRVEKLEEREGGAFVTLLRLIAGQIEAFKAKHAAGMADMTISARQATMGVRGTHFRMRQDGVLTFAEIEEGQVAFEAAKTPQVLALAGGEGSVADGVKPAEVIPLLPAPVFPPLPPVFDTPYIEWVMPDMPGATAYVGELARDEAFSRQVVMVRGSGSRIALHELENGRYWLKLRAVDTHGLQGMEGKISFTVEVPPRKFAMTKVYVSGKQLQLRWVGRKESNGYQAQVAATQDFQQPLLDVRTTDNWIDMPRPRPGRYFLRVRQIFAGGQLGDWDVPMVFEAP